MKQRLIDADALERAMYEEAFEKDTDMQRWDSGCWIRYKLFENVLDAQPTVDAVPVRHGKWIPHEDEDGEQCGDECSECGECYVMPYGKTNYCPNCGARMDAE